MCNVSLNSLSVKQRHIIFKKLKIYLFLTGILLIGIVVFIEIQLVPLEKKSVKKQSRSVAVKIINEVVENTLNKYDFSYPDISNINYSSDGDVKSIETHSALVNKIKSEVTTSIQNELDKEKVYCFSVPLGSLTKLNEFSSMGPDVEISFRLSGFVNSKIKSTFESVGVNQTVHHIYLVICANVITISPEYSKEIEIETDFEIAQTVIVGNTPSMYATIDK